MNREALLAELTVARNALYAALRSPQADDPLSTPCAENVRQLCGHLSAWENRLLTILQQLSQDGAKSLAPLPPTVGRTGRFCQPLSAAEQAFDEREVRKRRGWPWRDLLSELVSIREETGWTLSHMTAETLFTEQAVRGDDGSQRMLSPAAIVEQLIAHDRVHTADLQPGAPFHGRGGSPD